MSPTTAYGSSVLRSSLLEVAKLPKFRPALRRLIAVAQKAVYQTNVIENSSLSVIDTYQRHGEAWAALRGENLTEGLWLNRFCDLMPVGATVLDIGCGSGLPIARELLQRGFDVTGVDGTPAMLSLFKRNLPSVEAHLADMRQLSLNRRFSALLAWDSFFHLSPDDQRGMFARFQAHAVTGTALMFTSGDTEGEAIGTLESAPLYHGSLNPAEYRSLLDESGFALIAHVENDLSCGHRTIWLAQQTG